MWGLGLGLDMRLLNNPPSPGLKYRDVTVGSTHSPTLTAKEAAAFSVEASDTTTAFNSLDSFKYLVTVSEYFFSSWKHRQRCLEGEGLAPRLGKVVWTCRQSCQKYAMNDI